MEISKAIAEKIHDLKLKVLWQLGAELIDPPLPRVDPLKFLPADSEAQQKEKRAEYERKLNERDDLKARREPELLEELDKIIEKVKSSKTRKPINDNDTTIATSRVAEKTSDFYCPQCKNKVRRAYAKFIFSWVVVLCIFCNAFFIRIQRTIQIFTLKGNQEIQFVSGQIVVDVDLSFKTTV